MSSVPIERFQPSGARWVGVAGIVVIGVLIVLMAVDGFTLAVAPAAAGLVLFAVVMYVAMVRPALQAYADHLLIRNLVSDVRVPWHLISDAEVRQTLRVYTRDKMVHAVAIGRTARQQMHVNARSTGGGAGTGAMFGLGRVEKHAVEGAPNTDAGSVEYVDFVAGRVVALAQEHQQASRHLNGLERRWAYLEITVLVVVAAVFVALLVAASR